jgi:hypothetical protein
VLGPHTLEISTNVIVAGFTKETADLILATYTAEFAANRPLSISFSSHIDVKDPDPQDPY